jgi:hypothetical protein
MSPYAKDNAMIAGIAIFIISLASTLLIVANKADDAHRAEAAQAMAVCESAADIGRLVVDLTDGHLRMCSPGSPYPEWTFFRAPKSIKNPIVVLP